VQFGETVAACGVKVTRVCDEVEGSDDIGRMRIELARDGDRVPPLSPRFPLPAQLSTPINRLGEREDTQADERRCGTDDARLAVRRRRVRKPRAPVLHAETEPNSYGDAMRMRRKLASVALALVTLVALSGAEGCQDQGGQRGAGPPPRVPEPNPDTKARPPGTPNPQNADPAPGDKEHEYTVWATWVPAKNVVKIDWTIGTDNGPAFDYIERGGGKFSKNGKKRDSADTEVWIEVAVDGDTTKFYPIEINCRITKDGNTLHYASRTLVVNSPGNAAIKCVA
jgi:hypothetical protein